MEKSSTKKITNHFDKVHLGLAAINDFYKTLCTQHLHTSGYNAFYTGIDSPFFNVILPEKQNVIITPQLFQTFTQFLSAKNLPWSWFQMVPVNHEHDDEYHMQQLSLEQQGLDIIEVSPGLYFDLTLPLPESTIKNLRIFHCETKDQDLLEWSSVIRECYDTTDEGKAYQQLNAKLLRQGEPKLQHYVAYVEDELAAAGTLFLSQGSVVMLHNLATRHQFRKQGIGTALTLFLMSHAKKLNYQHCFLDASSEALSMYLQIGFAEYANTNVYQKL